MDGGERRHSCSGASGSEEASWRRKSWWAEGVFEPRPCAHARTQELGGLSRGSAVVRLGMWAAVSGVVTLGMS